MPRIFYFILFGILIFSVSSCAGDDDICISGEATPRMKIKFKTRASGQVKTLESVFVEVDYGRGLVPVISNAFPTDSIIIPLRVDNAPFTAIYVGLTDKSVRSKININYTTASEYVSPACGIKKVYQNVTATVEQANEVIGVEHNQNQITDERKTHLYLLF